DSARKKITSLSEHLHLEVNPDAVIEDLSVGQKQRVELVKVLFRDAEILILDEPTAVLSPQEVSELFTILRKMKER
ncbi:ATP-binding cassette domain-containing protein, partial [Escherichia coli]|nr:ATP-binding cassette domain-containing protein [Escherichia coli]